MKRTVISILLIFSLTFAVLMTSANSVYAASSGISLSTGSPEIGSTLTVTFTITGDSLGSAKGSLDYNTGALEYIADSGTTSCGELGEIDANSFGGIVPNGTSAMSFTWSFKVLNNPGEYSISAHISELYDLNYAMVSCNDSSVLIDIVGRQPGPSGPSPGGSGGNDDPDTPAYSSNACLASLSVSSGALEPAFARDIFEYTVHAAKDETSFTISAEPEDGNASVSVDGSTELTEDRTTRTVTVTAEDGTQLSYSITVIRDGKPGKDKDSDKISIGGRTYTAVKSIDADRAPEAFDNAEIEYNNMKLPALKSRDGKLLITQLLEEGADEPSWFRYDSSTGSFLPVSVVEVAGRRYLKIASGLDMLYGAKGRTGGYYIQDPSSGELTFISFEQSDDKKPAANKAAQDDNAGEKYILYGVSGLSVLLLFIVVTQQILIRQRHRRV